MEKLRDLFTGLATKYLSEVDTPRGSNQHEIGSKAFAMFLGDPGIETKHFDGHFLYFGEDEEPVQAKSQLSWYDTRRKNPSRSPELRLYYKKNLVTEKMSKGDFLLIAKRTDGTLLVVVTKPLSTNENQLRWLFNINQVQEEQFRFQEVPAGKELSFVHATVLQVLGIEVESSNEQWLDRLLKKFGKKFPSTVEFGNFARKSSKVDSASSADDLLMGWMAQEEMLFRTLEKHLVEEQLAIGFRDVNHFVEFSLQVQNRRKARAGRAFENHLAAIFKCKGLRFNTQVITEFKTKADFIFPSARAYANPSFPVEHLTLLAAKTSCKDRWRQVLAEAQRVPFKHLVTLEAGISEQQTDEMRGHQLQLVVPAQILPSYKEQQRPYLLCVQDFVDFAFDIQQRISD